MKLNRRFNQFTEAEYRHLLANYRRYTDFNSLGLFRSLLENEKLASEQRQNLRDAAVEVFPKFYEFLQLKDPHTYFRLSTLGQELTVADERARWQLIRQAQQRLLADKRIRHRNLGTYARHDCGYPECPFDGLMVRQGSRLADGGLYFNSDHRSQWQRLFAAERQKTQRTFRNARRTRWPEDL